jgi:hypothetical protein
MQEELGMRASVLLDQRSVMSAPGVSIRPWISSISSMTAETPLPEGVKNSGESFAKRISSSRLAAANSGFAPV